MAEELQKEYLSCASNKSRINCVFEDVLGLTL